MTIGRWQDCVADLLWDHVITDPPFSTRTHKGHNKDQWSKRSDLEYEAWGHPQIIEFVEFVEPRTKGWIVIMTDHVLAPLWERELAQMGRLVFAPIPFIHPGSRVRRQGDGPACWATWILVARRRDRLASKWRALPGGYVLPRGLVRRESERLMTGGKPLWLIKQLVEDYSRSGDTILDPCAGSGTLGIACRELSRSAILIDLDPAMKEIYEKR